jgi:PAS domain-containing protein
MHSDRRRFDAEDERIMIALGEFAAIAHQTLARVAAREDGEKALRRLATGAEQQARSMIDSALDAVIAMNAEGMITDWNPQAEESFGWSKEEALGDGCRKRSSQSATAAHTKMDFADFSKAEKALF